MPTPPRTQPRAPRRLGLAAATLLAGCTLLIAYVVHQQMPTSAFTLPGEERLRTATVTLLPEGWAFFTRTPREPDLLPFTRTADGTWARALLAPHAEARNGFGLDRASRAQGVEMGLLRGAVREQDFHDCNESVEACLARLRAGAEVRNQSPAPTLCGPVGLALRAPVPWAWTRDGSTTAMPSRVVRLEVRC
jgi:antimicrobial peptide system SdpA family protein